MTNPDDLPEARLLRMGLTLPTIGPSPGSFLPFSRAGRLLYISGQVPIGPDGPIAGQVGDTVTESAAREHARLVALRIVAIIRVALGSLDRVERIVKINGYVNAVPGFARQPAVIDGCSELLVEIFGDRGRHARAAVGTAGLPFNVPVEIEAIVQTVDEV
ncbi:MAG: RidA family protein [Gemmatimonadales bacterium]